MNTELSLVGISQTNSIAEANNKSILSGTRKLLVQAGLPACWWTYAAPYYCFMKNVMLDLNNDSAYYDTFGCHFPGKLIPFGNIVHFVPAPTKDDRGKTEPRLCTGMIVGYRTAPGGKWMGDYLVLDINDFSGIPLHSKTEPGTFKDIRPHITRTVKWTKHGINFPLFEKSIIHNETIEGIESCNIQMKRERARRKKEILPKVPEDKIKSFRAFAKFKQ